MALGGEGTNPFVELELTQGTEPAARTGEGAKGAGLGVGG